MSRCRLPAEKVSPGQSCLDDAGNQLASSKQKKYSECMGFASVFCQSAYLGPPSYFIQQLSIELCCLCQCLFPLSCAKRAAQCSLKHSARMQILIQKSFKVCFHSIRSIEGPSNKTYIPTSSYTPENGPLAGQSGPEGNNFSRH